MLLYELVHTVLFVGTQYRNDLKTQWLSCTIIQRWLISAEEKGRVYRILPNIIEKYVVIIDEKESQLFIKPYSSRTGP